MSKDPHTLVGRLYEHLEATAERPVNRAASRWIGEAEAVARDVTGEDVPIEVVDERLGHVERLLSEVDDTGDPAANDHVEAAKRLATTVREEIDDRS